MSRPLSDLALEIAKVNHANGWYDSGRSFGDDVALLHSEVSEAFEEHRAGHAPGYRYYSEHGDATTDPLSADGGPNKPEGVPSELADVLIRVLDTAYRYGIDMDSVVAEKLVYNLSRGHRHGGKVV